VGFSEGKELHYIVTLLVLLAGAAGGGADAGASEMQRAVSRSAKDGRFSGSYCGIYCLYSAMKYFDVDVEPSDLLRPEYIGSRAGSSLAELKKAAQDHGLFAEPVTKLTTRDLRHLPYPIILHVKSVPAIKVYDHYELFLHDKGGQAYEYDPPKLARAAVLYELAPRWDGTGLVLSNKPIDLGQVFAPARSKFIALALAAVAAVLTVRWGRRRLLPAGWPLSRRGRLAVSIAQGAGIAAAALLGGLLYHFVNDEGFLSRAEATAGVQQAYRGSFIPKIGERGLSQALAEHKVVFVDARIPVDFKTGHLEGAINIPADAADEERKAITVNIDKDARIVVYCQNSSCGFAQVVAVKLFEDGFSKVCIYKAGYEKLAAKSAK